MIMSSLSTVYRNIQFPTIFTFTLFHFCCLRLFLCPFKSMQNIKRCKVVSCLLSIVNKLFSRKTSKSIMNAKFCARYDLMHIYYSIDVIRFNSASAKKIIGAHDTQHKNDCDYLSIFFIWTLPCDASCFSSIANRSNFKIKIRFLKPHTCNMG